MSTQTPLIGAYVPLHSVQYCVPPIDSSHFRQLSAAAPVVQPSTHEPSTVLPSAYWSLFPAGQPVHLLASPAALQLAQDSWHAVQFVSLAL